MVRFYWLLIVVLAAFVAPLLAEKNCTWQNTVVYGQFIKTIRLTHPAGVVVTWEVEKGTSNITIAHNSHVSHNITYKNDEMILKVKLPKKAMATTINVNKWITCFMIFFCGWLINKRYAVLIGVIVLSTATFVLPATPTDCSNPRIHVKAPFDYMEKLCVNEKKCFEIKCTLSDLPQSYSVIPSDNKIMFKDEYCSIRKPEYWDDWVLHYFKSANNSESLYLADFDGDALVNIIEYYGNQSFIEKDKARTRRNVINVEELGTNPLNPDSDGDLLLDGFEYFNNMSPVKKDDLNADADGDGLSNLKEQILRTDPLNPDTDGDGALDGAEVKNNADPRDPIDRGMPPPDTQDVLIRITIGDHSGSHSERYVMHVGEVSHQSPGFGLVGFGDYNFKPGSYPITIQHVGTNLNTPDYDYRASVTKVGGQGKITVQDPQRILGFHHESTYDYTKGKSATLIVEGDCTEEKKATDCSCIKACEECRAKKKCYWNKSYCRDKKFLDDIIPIPNILFLTAANCACEKCQKWAEREKRDNAWLLDLNKNFKCPCKVRKNPWYKLGWEAIDNPSNKDWEIDGACIGSGLPGCWYFHPGADGCLRSSATSQYGARQQCCYDKRGTLLRPGHPGAGTPDKSVENHKEDDVEPYAWCCKDCDKKDSCDRYIKQARAGDASHCT
ncbi:uncharacterized protein LOC130649072 [Hydractinia symbiolongicarpus]|uniref:uncharacterized protein LOC130649072 n=1 Tax=Hydractinia symbiolongicarpus TaxID=13093 RepID=UPI00254FE7E7|nr:uncharacterized protein LOC130649072 [Hydractinia symbiolongicarpus]